MCKINSNNEFSILLIQSETRPLSYHSKPLRLLRAVGHLSGWVRSCTPEIASASPHVRVTTARDTRLHGCSWLTSFWWSFSRDIKPLSETLGLNLNMWYDILSRTPDPGGRIPPSCPISPTCPNTSGMLLPSTAQQGKIQMHYEIRPR